MSNKIRATLLAVQYFRTNGWKNTDYFEGKYNIEEIRKNFIEKVCGIQDQNPGWVDWPEWEDSREYKDAISESTALDPILLVMFARAIEHPITFLGKTTEVIWDTITVAFGFNHPLFVPEGHRERLLPETFRKAFTDLVADWWGEEIQNSSDGVLLGHTKQLIDFVQSTQQVAISGRTDILSRMSFVLDRLREKRGL